MGCEAEVALIGEDLRLEGLCQEILGERSPQCGWLRLAEPRTPLPAARLYIWDYRPGLEIAWEFAATEPRRHLILVERRELLNLRGRAEGALVALKPVTKTVLASWLEQALCDSLPEEQLRHDRDEILQALIETNLRLQEYDHDRTEFLARAIHDFRAPLTASCGYCGLLLDEQLGPLAEPQRQVVARVQASLKRLSRMTAAMFQLSVGPRVQRPPELEQADIREVAEQAVHEIGPRATERRLGLEISLNPPDEVMYFEPEQVEQVILNLLDNACKFTPKGGRIVMRGYSWFLERRSTRRAGVEAERRRRNSGDPNAYRVDVWNSGPPIEADRLGAIFEEYASYGRGAAFGTGLGLAICKVIVQQHRGRIWAENREGGPQLSFALPWRPEVQGSAIGGTENNSYHVKGTGW